jgi:glycogen debranching enzyme
VKSQFMVDKTVNDLFTDDMQNVSGLRTLSKGEKRFVPGGYHTGSVWLWVNNWVANGLDRQAKNYGRPDYAQKANQLRYKTWNVVQTYKKFPELVNGGDGLKPQLNWRVVVVTIPKNEVNRWAPGLNIIEELAQDYQAWTIAAYIDGLRKTHTQ